jgi:hypothetical protein
MYFISHVAVVVLRLALESSMRHLNLCLISSIRPDSPSAIVSAELIFTAGSHLVIPQVYVGEAYVTTTIF